MPLPQHELFRNIVLKFALSASKGPQRHKRLAKLYEHAIQCCPERGDPNKIPFPEKLLKLSNCPIFYLTPVLDESMIPILRLSYDLTDSSKPIVGLQLILIKSQKGEQEMSAIGFRFESSHGPGMHSYCHSQLIRGFEKADTRFHPYSPIWVPEGQPAICVDAKEPNHLFAVCFISLYGPAEWKRQMSTDPQMLKELSVSLKAMHLSL